MSTNDEDVNSSDDGGDDGDEDDDDDMPMSRRKGKSRATAKVKGKTPATPKASKAKDGASKPKGQNKARKALGSKPKAGKQAKSATSSTTATATATAAALSTTPSAAGPAPGPAALTASSAVAPAAASTAPATQSSSEEGPPMKRMRRGTALRPIQRQSQSSVPPVPGTSSTPAVPDDREGSDPMEVSPRSSLEHRMDVEAPDVNQLHLPQGWTLLNCLLTDSTMSIMDLEPQYHAITGQPMNTELWRPYVALAILDPDEEANGLIVSERMDTLDQHRERFVTSSTGSQGTIYSLISPLQLV